MADHTEQHTPHCPYRLRTYTDMGDDEPVKAARSIRSEDYPTLQRTFDEQVALARQATDMDGRRRWVVIEHVITEVCVTPAVKS